MDWPGEKVLTRVIDALENGIGGILKPWQTRRVAKANADARVAERLQLEQLELDIADLKAGRKKLDNGGKLISNLSPSPLLLHGPRSDDDERGATSEILEFARVEYGAFQARELQRAVNLKRVALYAEEEAEEIDGNVGSSEHAVSDTEASVDADWLAKWRSSAEDVSRDEMQRLWGRLLAGEVANPGRYSLHSIDFLARMSSTDANLLARVAPFATSAGIVRVGQDFFSKHGLTFRELLDLDDIGLINGTVGLGGLSYAPTTTARDGRAVSSILCGKHVLIFDLGPSSEALATLTLDVYAITRVGRELLTLASIPPDLEYLKLIAETALTRGAEVVSMGTLHPDGEQIMWPRPIARRPATP